MLVKTTCWRERDLVVAQRLFFETVQHSLLAFSKSGIYQSCPFQGLAGFKDNVGLFLKTGLGKRPVEDPMFQMKPQRCM